MKIFDQRWQKAIGHARRVTAEDIPYPPPGFTTRVLARSRDAAALGWDAWLVALSLRALIVTTALCLLSGGYAFSQWYQPRLEVPELANPLTTDLIWP